MRLALLLVIAAPALAAASVPIEVPRETIAQALARTSAEAKAAEARVAVLKSRERAASDEATRLRTERQRAAANIVLTEARLAAADVVGFFFVVLRRVCESSGSAVIAASRTTAAIRSFLYNNGPYWASVFSGTLLCYTANANFTPDTAFCRNREGLPHG